MSSKLAHPNPEDLKKLQIFTAAEAKKKAKVSQPTLSRWLELGIIERVSRGLYLHPECGIAAENIDFIIACKKFGPTSAIAGLSALFHYGLIEQVPQQIWILTPPNRVNTDKKYRCLRTKAASKIGIVDEDNFRITNIERTLLEALKHFTKIGERIALQATRKAIQDGLTTEVKLGKMANSLKFKRILEKYWEAIIP